MDYGKELREFGSYLGQHVQPGTANIYLYALRKWFDSLNGTAPTPKAAQNHIDLLAKPRAANTVAVRAHAIMRWFRWRKKEIHLDCPTIRLGEVKYLTMKEFDKVLGACRNSLEEALVVVLFDTAVRISELLNIELGDINREAMTISVIRKGGRRHEVNISEKGLAALDRWITERNSVSKRVFMDIDYWTAWDTIKRVGRRARIKVTPHVFRHTRAVFMLMKGADIHTVQQPLGHTNIATTINVYGRFRAAELRERIPSW